MDQDQNPTTVQAAGAPAEAARGPVASAGRIRLDPSGRARIAHGLRLLYAEVLTQPVPDALQSLVADLAARLEEPR